MIHDTLRDAGSIGRFTALICEGQYDKEPLLIWEDTVEELEKFNDLSDNVRVLEHLFYTCNAEAIKEKFSEIKKSNETNLIIYWEDQFEKGYLIEGLTFEEAKTKALEIANSDHYYDEKPYIMKEINIHE